MARESSLEQPLVNGHDGIADSDSDVEDGRRTWNRPILKKIPSSKELPRPYYRYLWALAFISVSLVSAWAGMHLQSQRSLDYTCAEHTTKWCKLSILIIHLERRMLIKCIAAPIIRDVPIEYKLHAFNGSFMDENIYRRPGSDEVDAAWEALGVNCKQRRVFL